MRRLMLVVVLLGTMGLAGAGQAWPAAPADKGADLAALREQVQAGLERLDQNLARAAESLSRRGLTGPAARHVLAELLVDSPEVIDVAAVDTRGVMVTMEPLAYRQHEGADISAQEQIQRLRKTGRPVMSQVFLTVEGLEAVDLEQPVPGPDGKLLGSVSILFQPSVLLQAAWDKVRAGKPDNREFWAMDSGGRIIFDQDQHEVNRFLFSDPLYQAYPELLDLGRRMLAQDSGRGTYRYPAQGGGAPKTKLCQWQSVSLHGSWWRLVLTRLQN